MACGCDTKMGCTCQLSPGDGISISGIGTAGDPFVITNNLPKVEVLDSPTIDFAIDTSVPNRRTVTGSVRLAPLFSVTDTGTVDMTLAGAGTEASPFNLSALIKGLILTGGTTGQVITLKPDGTWAPGPMTTAPAGAIATSDGIKGDGSGANPIRLSPKTYAEWETTIDNVHF